MIDNLIDRLDRWLDGIPAHLVFMASGASFIVGLWVLGHQWGLL